MTVSDKDGRDFIDAAQKYIKRTRILPPVEMKGLFSPRVFSTLSDSVVPMFSYSSIRGLLQKIEIPTREALSLPPDRFFSLCWDAVLECGFVKSPAPFQKPDQFMRMAVGLAVLHNAWNNRESWFTAPPVNGVSPLASPFALYGIEDFALAIASICTPQEWTRYGGGEALLTDFTGSPEPYYQGTLLHRLLGSSLLSKGPLSRLVALGESYGGSQTIGDIVFSCLTPPVVLRFPADHTAHEGISVILQECLNVGYEWGDRNSLLVPIPPSGRDRSGKPVPGGITPLDLLARHIAEASRHKLRIYTTYSVGGGKTSSEAQCELLSRTPRYLSRVIGWVLGRHADALLAPVLLRNGEERGAVLFVDVVARAMAVFGRTIQPCRDHYLEFEDCRSVMDLALKALSRPGVLVRVGSIMNRGKIAEGMREAFPDVAEAASTALACSKNGGIPPDLYDDTPVQGL